MKMKSNVVTSLKKLWKDYKLQLFDVSFSIIRVESSRLNAAPSIQEQKYFSLFAGCLKYHFSFSFSEEMVGLLFEFHVRRSFKNCIKKLYLNFLV